MKKYDLILAIIVAVLSIGTIAYAASNHKAEQASFADTTGHWAEASITKAVEKEYVTGYPDGTFRPNAKVSRAEFMKMVVAALQLPVTGNTSGSSWYMAYADAAIAAGAHDAKDFPSTAWNAEMNRHEMARMAGRALGKKAVDDKQWMLLATYAGLINGVDQKGTLDETKPMTRAQAVTVIERLLQVKGGAKLPKDKYAVSNADILWHKTNILTTLPYFFNLNRIIDMSDKSLTVSANNGNFVCTVSKYVVVDIEDPHDPNRGLLKGVKYRNDKGILVAPKDGFALISVNHLTIKENKLNLSYIQGCKIDTNLTLYDNQGKETRLPGLGFYDEPISIQSIPVKGIKDFNFTYYTGIMIPRGEFSAKIIGDLTMRGIIEFGHSSLTLTHGWYASGIGIGK
jgi:hypothetical protein